uniref:Uncharacterized protein n=1 Tax=Anguilla anguilla TaxID=7936 RepID=A0A0E9RSA1_ANGAN
MLLSLLFVFGSYLGIFNYSMANSFIACFRCSHCSQK